VTNEQQIAPQTKNANVVIKSISICAAVLAVAGIVIGIYKWMSTRKSSQNIRTEECYEIEVPVPSDYELIEVPVPWDVFGVNTFRIEKCYKYQKQKKAPIPPIGEEEQNSPLIPIGKKKIQYNWWTFNLLSDYRLILVMPKKGELDTLENYYYYIEHHLKYIRTEPPLGDAGEEFLKRQAAS
jgi:hypothetical protein